MNITYKSRKRRFLPIIDDITRTGISRNDDDPYGDTEQIYFVEAESNKDLKFLYPIKLAFFLLTYGLIFCLAYVIYLLPVEGVKGSKGQKGWKGWKGYRGMPGNIGEKGMQGDVGIQGFKGNKGSVGWFGIKGQKGHIGSRGSKGEKGLKGKQGLKGNKGKAGHVFSGDIGNKGFKGYIGDRGYDGFLIAVQGSKNNDHKYARSIEVIHNHQHHHSHSHEHNQKYGAHYNYTHHGTHYNHAEAVSRSSNDSDVVGSAAEQREGLTQHLLLDDEDLRIIEGFTSQELTEFIDAQLKLSGNGRGMKRIARSTQERESNNIPGNFNKFIHQSSYYLTPLSNFSEDVALQVTIRILSPIASYLHLVPTCPFSFPSAGFAHVLGDSGSLQLLDDVRRGRQRGVKMSCVKTGSSCSLEIQN
ncbi:hypothetical protein HAZT_HAZT004570 [Hyalella azteca]|uniref:Uncharacterized protein n=1 Tax=Hyalella azteca TaxID=294128 RepID=A0A6A0H5U4_HYAAZ|nr:hypothetical protein HAZT_HAZT004570 [Hyalella azteca]